MKNSRLESKAFEDGQRILIVSQENPSGHRVSAPLPEDISFTVGSEYGSPFAGLIQDNTVSSAFGAITGASGKGGISTKRVFSSPLPTDMTFELHFRAHTDALQEVMMPVITLMYMSVGVRQKVTKFLDEISQNMGVEIDPTVMSTITSGEKWLKKQGIDISVMRTPDKVTLFLGRMAKFRNLFISSVTPKFWSALDHRFLPLGADVSITFAAEAPWDKNDIIEIFGQSRAGAKVLREQINNANR